MADSLNLDWFAFELDEGQELTLDVDWGEGGVGRAEATLAITDQSGVATERSFADGADWMSSEASFADDAIWVAIDSDAGYEGGFTWWSDSEGGLVLDESLIGPADTLADEPAIEAAEADESGLFVGADIVFGDEIPIGDVLIGGDGRETYRVTSESEGETVTILDFHAGDGGDRLDISELLATGSGSLDVAYDSRSESTTVTVSGVGTEDTVIVVYGADLTSDFDTYVVTDTVV